MIRTIHLMARSKWLHWRESELQNGAVEVDVARGPVLDDETERTYFTGTDAPRVTDTEKAIGFCSQQYPCDSLLLGVPAPNTKPTVSVALPEVDEGEVLLDNAAAEGGTTTGWTIVEGGFGVAQNAGGISPAEGSYFFIGGQGVARTEAVQRVDTGVQALVVGSTIRVTWQQNGANVNDTAGVHIRFRDSNLNVLSDTANSQPAIGISGGWQERSVSSIVPEATQYMDVVQEFVRGSGTDIEAYIDDVKAVRSTTRTGDDGSNFNGWTLLSENRQTIESPEPGKYVLGNNDGGYIDIVDYAGLPPPCFQLATVYYDSVAMHRDYQLTKSPLINIEFDLHRGGGITESLANQMPETEWVPISIRLGVDAEGRGPTIYNGYAGEIAFGTGPNWHGRSLNRERTLEGSNIPGFTWVHVSITAERINDTSDYNVTVKFSRKDDGAVLVLAEEQMRFEGDRFGFINNVGSIDTWRTCYIDNVDVQVAPEKIDQAEEILESGFTSYVFTYVNEYGEESAPSLASRSVQKSGTATVTVETATQAPNGYGVERKRLYRAITDAEGTQFLFLEEIPLSQDEFADSTDDETLGEPLITQGWSLPPADMRGILALPNGIMVGHTRNEFIPSVQNRPHAYPPEFRLATDYPIVGLGAIDANVVVLTESNPYMVLGSSPDELSMQKVELPQGCVSKRSIASLQGFGVIYASPDGLIGIAGTGQTMNLTEQLFSRREWQRLRPETILGVAHDDRYFGFYEDEEGNKGGFLVDVKEVQGFGFVPLSTHAQAAYSDTLTDTLYLVVNDEVYAWNEGAQKLTYAWRSPLYQMQYPVGMAYAQIRAVDYNDITFRLYAEGALVQEKVVTGPREFVIPAVDAAREWEVELEGTSRVQRFEVAEDPEEIG